MSNIHRLPSPVPTCGFRAQQLMQAVGQFNYSLELVPAVPTTSHTAVPPLACKPLHPPVITLELPNAWEAPPIGLNIRWIPQLPARATAHHHFFDQRPQVHRKLLPEGDREVCITLQRRAHAAAAAATAASSSRCRRCRCCCSCCWSASKAGSRPCWRSGRKDGAVVCPDRQVLLVALAQT